MAVGSTSLYLLLGGENIQYILILGLALSVTFLCISYFMPESPRYLYERKLFDELRENINGIAKVNGVKMPENYVFDTEHFNKLDKNSIRSESKPLIVML